MSDAPLIDQVNAKDTELWDWAETEVIAITAHPLGWEILWAGEDNEPSTKDPVLFETKSIREAVAMAKERQAAEIARTAEQLRAVEELLPNYPDIPESQMRFVAESRVEDAGVE